MKKGRKGMNKQELDLILESMVGPKLVEKWWDSPNLFWGGRKPLDVYVSSDEGKSNVENYILGYALGK